MPDFEDVDAEHWHDRVTQARDDGFVFLSGMTAVDEVGFADTIRILLWLDDHAWSRRCALSTEVERSNPRLAGITDVFRGAAWLQRQIHDFFGVEFLGDDNRPLLNHHGGAPLLKDVLLSPRLEEKWPGALAPGESDAVPGRRRMVPPGVPEADVMDDGTSSAADIALSAAGSRARRRR